MVDKTRAEGKRNELWALPRVVSVAARHVRFDQPRIYYRGSEPAEAREGVEILVRTSAELPARAQAPVLFVGEVPLYEYEPAGRNLYRFYVYRVDKLKPGAPIGLGWPQLNRAPASSAFRFNLTAEGGYS